MQRFGKALVHVPGAVIYELQMREKDWPQLFPLFQFSLDNTPSPQRKHIAPIAMFKSGLAPSAVSTILCSSDCQLLSLKETQLNADLNVSKLVR